MRLRIELFAIPFKTKREMRGEKNVNGSMGEYYLYLVEFTKIYFARKEKGVEGLQ